MRIVPVPVLLDNYAYLVIAESGAAAVVDPSEAAPVLRAVEREGATLAAIWNTHHHWDHVGGNRDLLIAHPDLRVVGYAGDRARIPGITDPVEDGAQFDFGGGMVRVIFVPAHTSGHVAYHLPLQNAVFTGDTLFAGGCGRLFEGDARMMSDSLGRLTALSADTRVFCGHEYTEKNLRFALTLEPSNAELAAKYRRVEAQVGRGEPTVPTTIAEELATNPFLRPSSEELRRVVLAKFPDCPDDPIAVFAKTRELKDSF
ncbi:MAG: hydroxyacylglutathione hydrolase [Deltaproteobacteria bacterium]|nr:hydroxyacylglutathione hydrolase [Deltaproteobacteria bacterium]